ncbi:hypothetical protein J4474_03130 [Candidatus Pacearchaeota archaeon]|nr:hypothetical protein [Candidatus Pacearchaeota archaeon]
MKTKNKKSSAWISVLIILILVVIGVGIYFWLSGGDSSGVSGLGNSIPQPPALPE